jgi:2-dehydro-3-deoxyphosphogluconate aldolase/(4S)-4-hydroxy-2-oxoglutarate aldolase
MNLLNRIYETGIIAIIRASSSTALIQSAEALLAGGVNVIEVTLTTPGALATIEQVRQKLGDDVLLGAGSVLDPESARAAILAGAQFIVSPALNIRVIELCRRYSTPVIPGAYTPTEVVTAWESGADLIKIFPANVGGPEMIKALKAPLPQIKMVPVGGVEIENTASYIRAGAFALGVGSSLVNDRLLNEGAFSEITTNARYFLQEVKKGRGVSS